jgi:hypothetical protein
MNPKTHEIHEHVFSPEQARRIYNNTTDSGYNFRTAKGGSNTVAHLQDAMLNGEWVWQEANPIRLSDDWSTCSDGIHRLIACAQAGVPLRSLVLVGDQWRAGVNSDRGRSRTLAQYFAHHQITNPTVKAAITRSHLARIRAVERGTSQAFASGVLVHDAEMIEFASKYAADLDWVASRVHAAQSRGANGTGYGVFLLEGVFTDAELVADFHETYIGPSADNEVDPIIAMRQFASRRYDATGKRLTQDPTIKAMVKCWDLRLRGESLKMWKQPTHDDIRFPAGFPVPERSVRAAGNPT